MDLDRAWFPSSGPAIGLGTAMDVLLSMSIRVVQLDVADALLNGVTALDPEQISGE